MNKTKRPRTNYYIINNPEHGNKIIFDDNFNEDLTYYLNEISKCTHIKFGDEFNQSIDYLPDSIISIKFGDDFNIVILKGDEWEG